jgi:PAS domain S-box-containing protein
MFEKENRIEGAAIDITARKKTEQKLKENTEFTENVFNAIQDGLSVLDLDLNIVKVNPYMIEMYGPIDQILNRKCYDVFQKRSSPCPWCPSIKTIETGQLNTSIVPYPTTENPTGWIELTTYPLKNSDGVVEGIIESLKDITERKKMMEELRIKDIVFNASLSAQSTADINGIIDHVNPAFLELWGYKSNEEAIGNSVGSFFENPDDAIPVLKALTETGKWEGEFLAKRNDGSTFISQGFATTIYNEQGEQIGFQSANLDVTKHREADKKLEESEKKYRTLYESNLDGITHVDMEGNFIDANKTLLDMIGYTMEDLKRKTFHELTPQKYSEVDENSVNQIMTIGYCDEYEKEFIRKDGTHFPINLKGWLERDDKGEPIGLWGIIRDITEHKNAEILIQESVENFMDIVNNSPDGFIIADEKGRHLFANQRVADITGYGIEEFVSMTGWDLTRPEDKKELKEMMKKVLRRETHNMPYERILLRKDGSEIFTEFNGREKSRPWL